MLSHRLLPPGLPAVEYPEIKKILMHNHLQDNFHLSNKKALFYNIRNYMALLKQDPFSIIPLTFHVQDSGDPVFQEFRQLYREMAVSKETENIWIIKPGENSNRGVGIRVSDSLEEISRLVQKSTHRDGQ